MNIENVQCDNSMLNGKSNKDGILKLHRLRYHLAVEGCIDSQLSLAKSFLNEAADSDFERKENAELAVRWILMASFEGNKEALALLESCYNMGIGVTERNRNEIENCLRTTPEEKLAWKIGYSLFRSIAYDIEEAIPLECFQHHIFLYLSNKGVSEELQFTQNSQKEEHSVTVKDVVKSLHQCLRGETPSILLSETSSSGEVQMFDNRFIRFFHLSTCTKYVQLSYNHLLQSLSEVPLAVLYLLCFMIISVTTFLVLPALYFVQFQEENYIFFSHLFLHFSYFIMVITSVKIINCEGRFENFQIWKKIIYKFDEKAVNTVTTKSPDNLYAFGLFIIFVLAVIVFITQSDIAHNHSVLYNGLLFVSIALLKSNRFESHWSSCLFLTFNLLLAFSRLTEIYNQINLFSEYRYALHLFTTPNQLEITMDSKNMLSVFVGSFYIYILFRYSFLSSLRFTVSIIWLHAIVQVYYHANERNYYGFVFWPFALFLHRKLGLNFIFSAMLVLDFIFCRLNFIYIVFGVAAHSLSAMVVKNFRSLSRNGLLRMYSLIVVILLVLSHVFSKSLPPNSFSTTEVKNITWTKYATLCHRQAWSASNIAQTQINCAKFEGQSLTFEANVASVSRIYTHSLLYIPDIFLPNTYRNPISVSLYEIKLHIKGTFRVEAELSVQCDDRCKEFVLSISEGDLLNVSGILHKGIGTGNPILHLQKAVCLSCIESRKCDVKRFYWVTHLKTRLFKAIRFIFYPWLLGM